MAHKIFLTGFMGCGKSSLGRRLAARSGWEFLDTDNEIERRAGMPIPEIFAQKGEEWFRELERQVVDDAGLNASCSEVSTVAEKGTVVALGGGAVCREGVMESLANAAVGPTVYLKMSPARLVSRIDQNGRAKRPKIAGMNDAELVAYIEKTLPEREKYYNKATFVVDCDTLSDDAITDLLLQQTDPNNVK